MRYKTGRSEMGGRWRGSAAVEKRMSDVTMRVELDRRRRPCRLEGGGGRGLKSQGAGGAKEESTQNRQKRDREGKKTQERFELVSTFIAIERAKVQEKFTVAMRHVSS